MNKWEGISRATTCLRSDDKHALISKLFGPKGRALELHAVQAATCHKRMYNALREAVHPILTTPRPLPFIGSVSATLDPIYIS